VTLFIVITGTTEYSGSLIFFDHNSVFDTNKFFMRTSRGKSVGSS